MALKAVGCKLRMLALFWSSEKKSWALWCAALYVLKARTRKMKPGGLREVRTASVRSLSSDESAVEAIERSERAGICFFRP